MQFLQYITVDPSFPQHGKVTGASGYPEEE
jgi:hypothetical protein